MSDWVYDVLKDLVVPGLAGVGGIVVGTGATVAAFSSYWLARQVRRDEQKREADAARERYRDQLFRTIEPAVTAALEHRAELLSNLELDTQGERVAGATVIARLQLVRSVTNSTDFPVAQAFIDAFLAANKTKEAKIVAAVLGDLAITLPGLLSDMSSPGTLKTRADAMVLIAQHAFEQSTKAAKTD